ncbi:MAG: flagellar assembly protein FliW [Defluviitaleaceae bacterium]|nr:flagellar assembly protein FliW [Defluviitaleaceae bacterium]MCL2836056.1 flagellar assembly protein FliW [Defluviitaleaceae bacterium]
MIPIHTRNFGDIEIASEKILNFSHGLPGFPDLKRFTLIADPADLAEESAVFYWLQSLDNADVAFCIVDLMRFMPDYNPLVDAAEIAVLGGNHEDYLIYNIIVVHDDAKDICVNMKAPIIINPETREGMQIICQNEDYAIRHRLFK